MEFPTLGSLSCEPMFLLMHPLANFSISHLFCSLVLHWTGTQPDTIMTCTNLMRQERKRIPYSLMFHQCMPRPYQHKIQVHSIFTSIRYTYRLHFWTLLLFFWSFFSNLTICFTFILVCACMCVHDTCGSQRTIFGSWCFLFTVWFQRWN